MKVIYLMLIAAFMLSSCSSPDDNELPIPATNIIVENALVSEPPITEEMRYKEFVIQTDSLNIFNLEVSFDDGVTYEPIDFSNYTLLGKYDPASGCEVIYSRNATRDDEAKKISYEIKVDQYGVCDCFHLSMNWVLIPKMPEDYNVEFSVEHIDHE